MCRKKLQTFLAIIFLVLPSFVLATTLTATANRSHIDIEETLELSVKLDAQAGGDGPDFTALEMNFDILSNNRSTQYRSVNGKSESWTEWKLILSPKKIGMLLIPSVSYRGLYTEAQIIEVKQQAPNANNRAKDIFIEASVSNETVSVQEQVILTVKLFTSVNLRSINSDELDLEDTLQIELSELRYQKRINGKPYAVIEVKYALFPQTSGTLHIPSLTYTAATKGRVRDPWSDPFGTQTGELKRLKTKAIDVEVQAAASSYTGQHWLPSSALALEQEWSNDPSTFKVGEPITRVITLTAEGLTGAQLPPLELPDVEGIKYYPDQAQTQDQTSENGLIGIRTETLALVPMKSGNMTLPEISITWWDTQTKSQRVATLPETQIEVAPSTVIQQQPQMPSVAPTGEQLDGAASQGISVEQNRLWMMVSALLAVICLFLAGMNWRLRRALQKVPTNAKASVRSEHIESERQAYESMISACKDDSPVEARKKIIAWGNQRWPQAGGMNLSHIGQLCENQDIQQALHALDAEIYQLAGNQSTGNTSWSGKKFIELIKALRAKKVTRRGDSKQLKALYPLNN